ncbi:ribosome small subunit-dependent GTPase A [Anoxynatronum buryatiense]|uniref:Small ribosomal subunit biogenesis GTPase RsgA n=1 Tax=Anoxynatronum buryatiense TaxID=489973 RepID=A0AA45WU93_9CLOT|nr:ribosome small subunit-dependent GTPase A [Anoxynatronum buryatiense]SMP46911.1 ribosome biogenesis GTPase [Anoxynatronum buryatiense]
MIKGRIVKAISGFFYVQTNEGVITCKGRGILKKKEVTPLVGDEVEVTVTQHEVSEGMLELIYRRHNELIRPPVANVDQVLVVFAHQKPAPNFVLLDRILVMAESQQLPVIICFNKMDMNSSQEDEKLMKAYKQAGYQVLHVSAATGEGLSTLKSSLQAHTTALAGTSGVGKSTLINSLFPGFSLETGKLSVRINRGKHTTRHSELFQVNDETWLMDTPGFSTLTVDYLEKEEVRHYFREIEAVQEKCRFSSCLHLEEPGCFVKEAVNIGDIHSNRYQNYKQIIEEIRQNRRY